MTLTEEILAALGRLGSTAEEVAESLQAKGIKGHPRRADSCPLTNYLKDIIPELGDIRVGDYTIAYGAQTISNPMPAREFVHQFDRGAYSHLELQSELG